MYDVTMPKLSDSMELGKIIGWRVGEGDEVREGDVLAEVESDKAVMELECFHDGTLVRILHGDGSEVAVGEVIGQIAAKGETPAVGKPAETPPVREVAKAEGPGRKKPPVEKVRKPEAPAGEAARGGASPFARRLAREKGLDISGLKGTGPGGRVVARDVEEAVKAAGEAKAEKPPSRPATEAAAPEETREEPPGKPAAPKPSPDEELPALDVLPDEATVEEASFRFRTLAMRVTASKHVIPHFYVTRGADVTELLKKQETLKEKFDATITHLVELAALKTLKKHPDVNRSYDRGRIIRWKGIHMGLAVNTDQGLTVAVLRDAQDFGLKDVVERTTALVRRAREGKLSGEERRHPTFTISNLGMFDVEQFEPIINPPSSMTLAVASALDAPVVRNGKLEVGKVMKLTVSCDHRIIDGVTAAQFLRDLTKLLENPDDLLAPESP